MSKKKLCVLHFLLAKSPGDVDLLELIETREHTSSSNTTENVSTSTVEERGDAFLGDDLSGTIQRALVLDSLTRGHHHTTTNGIQRIRGKTGNDGDSPSKSERGEERSLEWSGENHRLEGIVETEVATAVDDNSDARDPETSVETNETIGLEGLGVDINETLELALSSLLGSLVVVGKTGTGVVKRVHEAERQSSSQTTRGHVTTEPLEVAILISSEVEQGLELFLEGQVQGLGGEITEHVGPVSSPQGDEAFEKRRSNVRVAHHLYTRK